MSSTRRVAPPPPNGYGSPGTGCSISTYDGSAEGTVGGFVFFVDSTDGNSTAGLLNSNISGISYTGGAVGVQDTLGPGPTCPTSTFGGALPQNPLFVADTACHINDDGIARGSFLSEFWDTTHGFVG